MDLSNELMAIVEELKKLNASVAIIAEDIRENCHAKHVQQQAELDRMIAYRDEVIAKANDADDEEEAKGYFELAKDVQRSININLAACPYLKGEG